MDNRIRQILISSTSKQATSPKLYTNFEITSSRKLLPSDDNAYMLDVNKQFNTERQNSTYYRILGTINPITSNPLFNTTDIEYSWKSLSTPLFTDTGYNNNLVPYTFAQSIQNHLKEIDGWFGYFDPVLTNASLCNYFDMEPKRERFSFIPDITNLNQNNLPTKNWEITITYPFSADTKHPMINNGLLIVDSNSVIIGGKNMTALSVAVNHNLNVGDSIILTGTNMDGTYDIKRLGLDDGSLQNNYFCINLDITTLSIGDNSRMIKLYNGVPSKYYFRLFKPIKTTETSVLGPNDYEIYKLGFSENIFTDDITQFLFNKDIDVSDLVDNLGRPLSQLYLTTIKTDSNNIFSEISSGIESPFIPTLNNGNTLTYLKNIPVIQKIHNVLSAPSETFTPLETNVTINNSYFYGDVVEYNIMTVQEISLSDVYHRFNTINRETTGDSIVAGPRPEGYYYKAHNLMTIRIFSSYIEQGDLNTIDIPDYATNLGDGTYLWRSLLDIGQSDIKYGMADYPFLNGCHYLYQNYCFNVRRQDPFDNWNLYFYGFPADPLGDPMSNNFKVNKVNNVC
jgi:hypothetical protein